MLHNLLLTVGSGLLLALMLEEVRLVLYFSIGLTLISLDPSFRSFLLSGTRACSLPFVTRAPGLPYVPFGCPLTIRQYIHLRASTPLLIPLLTASVSIAPVLSL